MRRFFPSPLNKQSATRVRFVLARAGARGAFWAFRVLDRVYLWKSSITGTHDRVARSLVQYFPGNKGPARYRMVRD